MPFILSRTTRIDAVLQKTLTVFSQTFSVFPYPFSSYRKSTLADDVDVCGDSDDVTEEEDEA